jgi:hypothetical protein
MALRQDVSLYLATPCYGGMAHAIYMRSLLALRTACAARGVGLELEFGGGEALIARARASMMGRFLKSGATHLLFVDADIGFAADDVFRLLNSGKDIVGGAYPRKPQTAGDLQPEFELLAESEAGPEPDDGLRRAAFVGTAFLLISRAAALRLEESYPHLRAKLGDVNAAGVPDAVMVFDSMIDPDTGRYLTDYQALSRRWRDIGGELWIHTTARVAHLGEIQRVLSNGELA